MIKSLINSPSGFAHYVHLADEYKLIQPLQSMEGLEII